MAQPRVSFEFFPPQDLSGSFRLWDAVNALMPFDPTFASVTYGAGGTTRNLTQEAVKTLHRHTGWDVAGHLTCVDATKAETLAIARDYADAGLRDIVALRGDAPKGATAFTAHPQGFQSSIDLIGALKDTGQFNIHVGAYPEVHPEAASQADNIAYLKRKCDAGADSAITQFFFEADTFFQFRDACADAGITTPIIPGILPVENWTGVQSFAAKCGTAIPQVICDGFTNAQRDGTTDLFATAIAAELCDELISGGVDHLHFYTLNRAALTRDVCHALGLGGKRRLQNVA